MQSRTSFDFRTAIQRALGSMPPANIRFLAAVGAVALALTPATPVSAQTTANGPYYATPSWDQSLPVATRFIVLTNMDSQAVLDRETGLVWERSPTTARFAGGPPSNQFGGLFAHEHCISLRVGGRMGWRLPTIQELSSLVDTSQTSPALPAGHPFLTVLADDYWSATVYVNSLSPGALRTISFVGGGIGAAGIGPAVTLHVWCVRGGPSPDGQ